LLGHGVTDHDLKFDLGHEVHFVLGPAINFCVAGLGAKTSDFRYHHASDADVGQGDPDLFQLERFDCCND